MKDNKRVDSDDIAQMILQRNTTLCYYSALRHPPDHPQKYELTNDYWYQIGVRLLCVIVFEVGIFVILG